MRIKILYTLGKILFVGREPGFAGDESVFEGVEQQISLRE